jgi:hexosaminidase
MKYLKKGRGIRPACRQAGTSHGGEVEDPDRSVRRKGKDNHDNHDDNDYDNNNYNKFHANNPSILIPFFPNLPPQLIAMKKCLSVLLFFSIVIFSNAQINIIPAPSSVKQGSGNFIVGPSTVLQFSSTHADVKRIAGELNAAFKRAAGFELKAGTSSSNVIQLVLNSNASLGNEGYQLSVTANGVKIAANKPAGLFYGMQSLLQLFPAEIESKTVVKYIQWKLPVVEIQDQPRFGWRGTMLDVSRHFFTKEEVKSFLDDMAKYKYNTLHFHLTDDQGWRIEIKSLPKLTQVGAWNVKKTGRFNYFTPPADDERRNYGGFYTQEDLKELIKYAKERFIEILPEIDIPGHSLAAVASYPDLSCTPGNYKVNSGEPFMDWHNDGTFTARVDNTLCPANEKVYEFLDKVFTEVAAIFPHPYIHMGGDECAKNFWEISPQIKDLMQREKLKDMHEVQSYFVGRVSKIVNAKGKKLIGWDEILEGGLVKDAAVMSWRGMKGGIEAAKMGHEVVMTPTTYVYVDYMQGDAAIEPPVYATLRLKKSYEFEPLPDGVDPKLIKGGQANMWTEQIFNTRHLGYMMWPRGFAIAEALWSPKTVRDWKTFVPRVENHFTRFKAADKTYAPSIYDPAINVKKDAKGNLLVDFETEIDGLAVHYSFDNSFPDQHYPHYAGKSVQVPVDAAPLKVITSRNGKLIGRMMTISIEELRKRAK